MEIIIISLAIVEINYNTYQCSQMANLTDTGTKADDNTQAFPSVFNDLSEESAVGSLKLLTVSFLTELLWFN